MTDQLRDKYVKKLMSYTSKPMKYITPYLRISDYEDSTFRLTYQCDWMNYSICTVAIKKQPKCCGVGVVTNVHVDSSFSPMSSVYKIMNDLIFDMASRNGEGGYGQLIVTTSSETKQLTNLCESDDRWNLVKSFRNPKTSRKVKIYLADVK